MAAVVELTKGMRAATGEAKGAVSKRTGTGKQARAAGKSAWEETSLALYMKDIVNTKALSRAEEAELAVRIRKGDRKALDKLVKANLRFVVSVARNYQNQGHSMADLINEGNLGLVKAAKRFDESKKYKFISYAVWWVRQCILQALAEQSRVVKLPLNRVGTIHKVGKTSEQLAQALGRSPDAKEVARAMRVGVGDVVETERIGNSAISLDAPLLPWEGGKLLDQLQYADPESVDRKAQRISLGEEVGRILDTLSPREAEVVKLYFGIGREEKQVLDGIMECGPASFLPYHAAVPRPAGACCAPIKGPYQDGNPGARGKPLA